jgi:hypothetical protein
MLLLKLKKLQTNGELDSLQVHQLFLLKKEKSQMLTSSTMMLYQHLFLRPILMLRP